MNIDWLFGEPPPAMKLLENHTNRLVRERAVELEAFIVAWCKTTGLNPADLVLEQWYDLASDSMKSKLSWRSDEVNARE